MGASTAAAVEERIPRRRQGVRLKISGKEVRLTDLGKVNRGRFDPGRLAA